MPTSLKAEFGNNKTQASALLESAIDITGAELLEIITQKNANGSATWVLVNNVCVLRIYGAKSLMVNGEGGATAKGVLIGSGLTPEGGAQ